MYTEEIILIFHRFLYLILFVFFYSFSAYAQTNEYNKKTSYELVDDMESYEDIRVLNLSNFENINKHIKLISKYKNVNKIIVRHNKNIDIDSLFINIKNLDKLDTIDISYCNIKNMPTSIKYMNTVKVIYLFGNSFKYLPSEISCLKNLNKLYFCQTEDDFRSWRESAKLNALSYLPHAKILLVDCFGGVHGRFLLGKRIVEVKKNSLFPVNK
ncbi:leucine-rich repeat domain-containing protein [Hymenobacter rubripertinctus]|uniref:hypothetical protein n=1 Tax=Hymenobacter rubripertinctus TaxID=2029981 RepID=UPI0011C3D4A3|nr:hypothetical protein [Hymenobacter rubripertinctus]